ncbi:hypothetical protein QZH41_017492, partial [Actinostola sp. cb2023]
MRETGNTLHPAKGLRLQSQIKIQPRALTCYSAINQYPGTIGMVGVRYVTKAKAVRGGVKPKPVPGYRVGVTKGFDSQHT